MINDADIRAKTDAELLDIWANQTDYVGEVVEWVRQEIERRSLDVGAIHVRTAEEVNQERELSDTLRIVRGLTAVQAVGGIVFLAVALSILRENPSNHLDQTEQHQSLGLPALLLGIGVLFIVYAIGVWRRKRWALVSGFVVYSLATIFNLLGVIFVGFVLFTSKRSGVSVFLVLSLLDTMLTASLASMFNQLRKTGTR